MASASTHVQESCYRYLQAALGKTARYKNMVAILDNYQKVKANINLVPSLFTQLEEYASGKAKDKFLDLTLKGAQTLTNDDKVFVLMNFYGKLGHYDFAV